MWLLDKLKRENTLTIEEYECLTSVKALELVYYAAEHAAEARKKVYGNEVYIEGLIETGSSCLGYSCYCDIRRSNKTAKDMGLQKNRYLAVAMTDINGGFAPLFFRVTMGCFRQMRLAISYRIFVGTFPIVP